MNTTNLTLFRHNIIQALRETSSDDELRMKLHNLLQAELKKDTPFLLKPTDKKVVH